MKMLYLSALVLTPLAVAIATPASAQDYASVGCRDANCSRVVQEHNQQWNDPGYRPGNYGSYGGYNIFFGASTNVGYYYDENEVRRKTWRRGGKWYKVCEGDPAVPIDIPCRAIAPQVTATPPASAAVAMTGAPFHPEGNFMVRYVLNPDGQTYHREAVPAGRQR